MRDIFFETAYGKLYERIEKGVCEVFEFHHELGSIRYLFIKRQLPFPIGGETYYDITTPYGYGGPVVEHAEKNTRNRLVELFDEAFSDYCKEQKIISEFVRFHPLLANAQDFSSIYDVSFRRHTTGTNLTLSEDPSTREFSKSTRRNIRKALKEGVTFQVTVNPPKLHDFLAIYYETMKRNDADAIYFFDEIYFSECLSSLGDQLIFTEVFYEGKTIGAGINFCSGKWIHSHLSGTAAEYHHLSPASVLQYALVQWGKENGKELIHDGGGRSSALDDSLYLFKKQFGKHTEFDYFVGHNIRDVSCYRKACELAGIETDSADSFPAYRAQNEMKTFLVSAKL